MNAETKFPDSLATRSPGTMHLRDGTQIKIDLGGATLIVVAVLALIIGACGIIMGLNLSKQDRQDADFRDLKTQSWLTERRLMDREALDILHGIKVPGDDANGPTGNLQRMKPKER